jgi:hypothetical protein
VSSTTIAPPTTSEWPFRYFVVECTTAVAPSSRGRCSAGVANVLSTHTGTRARRATSIDAARSTTRSSGFVGLSSHTILVSGRSAASRFAGSANETKVVVMPADWRKTLSKSR